ATPGDWVATFDDMAVTQNQIPGPGRVIARQGRPGAPTYGQFTLVGAGSIDAAWSQTPANGQQRAESPATGDPVAQSMLGAPFDAGLNPMLPTSVIGACQTWIDANTAATPDRTYAVRRRLGGVDTDTTLTGLGTAARPLSEGLLGGFWTSTLANLDAAEIGAVKSGGAGGATLQANDLWLMCEYAPPTGEPPCNQSTATSTSTSTTSTTSSTAVTTTSTIVTSTTSTSTSTTSTTSTTASTTTSTVPTPPPATTTPSSPPSTTSTTAVTTTTTTTTTTHTTTTTSPTTTSTTSTRSTSTSSTTSTSQPSTTTSSTSTSTSTSSLPTTSS